MNNLLNVILYIFKAYPNVEELSKPRLVKLVYLIDWKFTIENGRQYTNINWYYNHYGPYVEDVINTIKNRRDIFTVHSFVNQFGTVSDKITLHNKNVDFAVTPELKSAADFIISNTAHMNWSEFITLVYSSYPVKINSQYTIMNLTKDAEKFRNRHRDFN